MNNQDLLYNIALVEEEVNDVMNTLADKANSLGALQKKIYGQAIQQKKAFTDFINEASSATPEEDKAQPAKEPVTVKETGKKDSKKGEEING